MEELRIYLDKDDPLYGRLATTLRENLNALESVGVKEITEPVAPGTLWPGAKEVLCFVVSHATELLNVASNVMNLLTQVILLSRSADKKDKDRPVIIEIGEVRISLPASAEAERKFLRGLKSTPKARKQTKVAPETRRRGKRPSR